MFAATDAQTNGAPRDPRRIAGMLAQIALFRSLGPRPLADLAARAKAVHVRRGSIARRANGSLSGVHAVAYGQGKLSLRAEPGQERVLRIVGPGDSFGLAGAILGRVLPYEAVALEDSLLLVVPAPALLALIDNDPRFMRTAMATLAEQNLALLSEVEAGSLRRAVQRLASYLGALAMADGGSGEFVARLPTTKTVVAARLGVKKETLSRMLRELAEKRLIAVEQRRIAILDRSGLAALASERG